MSDDLIAWLLEQIAEDETLARRLPDRPRLGGRPSRIGARPMWGLPREYTRW